MIKSQIFIIIVDIYARLNFLKKQKAKFSIKMITLSV